jgi:hypothetical protein
MSGRAVPAPEHRGGCLEFPLGDGAPHCGRRRGSSVGDGDGLDDVDGETARGAERPERGGVARAVPAEAVVVADEQGAHAQPSSSTRSTNASASRPARTRVNGSTAT